MLRGIISCISTSTLLKVLSMSQKSSTAIFRQTNNPLPYSLEYWEYVTPGFKNFMTSYSRKSSYF